VGTGRPIGNAKRVRTLTGVALLCIGLYGLGSVPSRAQAQAETSTHKDPPGYGEAIDAALAEYSDGHFAEALALFGRAHAIAPSARTARGLGMAQFELRHYTESAEWLEQALASQMRPLSGTLRVETQELLNRAEGFIARLSLTVEPKSARVAVAIDGGELAAWLRHRLVLDIGDHVLDVSAEGYAAQRRVLRIQGGEVLFLKFKLSPLQPSPLPPSAANVLASDRAESDARWYTNGWLWGGAGAVVVGAALLVVFIVANSGAGKPTYYGGDTNTVLNRL
jgi:hypothetical protein